MENKKIKETFKIFEPQTTVDLLFQTLGFIKTDDNCFVFLAENYPLFRRLIVIIEEGLKQVVNSKPRDEEDLKQRQKAKEAAAKAVEDKKLLDEHKALLMRQVQQDRREF